MDTSDFKIIRGDRILQQIEAEETLEERSSYQDLERKTIRAFPHTRKRQHAVHPVKITKIDFTPYIGTRNLLVRGQARSGTYNNVYYKPMLFFNEVQFVQPGQAQPKRPEQKPEPEQPDQGDEVSRLDQENERDRKQQQRRPQQRYEEPDDDLDQDDDLPDERVREAVEDQQTAGTVVLKASDGKDYRLHPIDLSDNIVRVRCDCLDFYFRFAPWDFSNDDLFGPKPKPYVRKTTHYPPVNPTRSPGICKHVMKLVLAMRDARLLKR